MRLLHRLLLPVFAVLALTACHRDESGMAGGSTPVVAVQGSLKLLKTGDFNGLWKHALPPADYASLRADWQLQQARLPATSAAEQSRFDAVMAKLNAPNAQDTLDAELQPKLAQLQQQYKDQLPVLVAMGGAFLKNGVAQSKTLDSEQKTQLDSLLDVLTPWAQQAPWFDPARARQAVGVAVTTARQLGLHSPAELRQLDFDAAMAKYATTYAGLKQVLAIYGLPLDEALTSATVSPVSEQGDRAVVRVDYTLLGKPLSAETSLVRVDGRWYSASLVDNVREAHARLQTPTAH